MKHAFSCHLRQLVLLTVVLALAGLPTADAMAVTLLDGPIVGSSTSTITIQGYGKPNQHRTWYNTYRRRWDGLIPKNNGLLGSDHFIMKDVVLAQTFTSLMLENRDDARPDTFWDDAGKTLYVLGSHGTTTKLWVVEYNDLTDTYALAAGLSGVTVPGMKHSNPNEPASIYMTPNGTLWVAVMRGGGLLVQRSLDDGITWLAAPMNLNTLALKGVVTWSHVTVAGTTYATLFASEDAITGTTTHYYYWRINQGASPAMLANWVNESAKIPRPGIAQADDHVSSARDLVGNQYFVVKTQDGAPTDALIALYRRAFDGKWSLYKVTQTQDKPEQSRPSVVVNTDSGELSVYTTDTGGGAAHRKRVSLNSPQNLNSAPLTAVLASADGPFTDLLAPRGPTNYLTGIVVIANKTADQTMWYSEELPISVSACTVTGGGFTIKGHEIEWRLMNAGLLPVTISRIVLSWPTALGSLREVKREGDVIYNTSSPPPSVDITAFVGDPLKRTIANGKSNAMHFNFSKDAFTTRSSYRIHVEFSGGCSVDFVP